MDKKIIYIILIIIILFIFFIIYLIRSRQNFKYKEYNQKMINNKHENHKKYLNVKRMNQINNYKRKMNSLMRAAYLREEKQVDKENIENTIIGNSYFIPESNILNLTFPNSENKIFKENIYIYSDNQSQSGENYVKTFSNDNTLIQRLDLNDMSSNYSFKNDVDSIIDGIGVRINNGNIKRPVEIVSLNKTLKETLNTDIEPDYLLQNFNDEYFGCNYEFCKKTFNIYMLNDLFSNENNINPQFLDELVSLVYNKPINLKKDNDNIEDIYSYVQRDVNTKEKFNPNNIHVDENDFLPYINFMKKWGSHFIDNVTFGKLFSVWEIFNRNMNKDLKIEGQKRIELCKKACSKFDDPENCMSNIKETFEYYQSTSVPTLYPSYSKPTPYPGYSTPTPFPYYSDFDEKDILDGVTNELINYPDLNPSDLNFDINNIYINCKTSNWSEWSECSKKCGGGTQNRIRTVINDPKYGGSECPSLSESQECNTQPCPINCEVSEWSEWSDCNTQCGGGVQNRKRKVINEPKYGGSDCPSLSESKECNTQPCIINCEVSEWSEWSDCSTKCGGGIQNRSRTVLKEPKNGGSECPSLSESQECNTQPCPIDCEVSEWSEWSDCSTKCGGGTQNRKRTVIKDSKYGGSECPSLLESQNCNTQPCPINCEVSEWSEWTKCTKECDTGMKNRTRTIIKESEYGGDQCPPLTETIECNTQPCVDCNSEFCKNTEYNISYGNFCTKEECSPPYKFEINNDKIYCTLDLKEDQKNLLNRDNDYIKKLFKIKEMLLHSSSQKESLEGVYTKDEIEDAFKLPTIKKINLFATGVSYKDFINYENNLIRINNDGLSKLINNKEKDVPILYEYKPIWELLRNLYFTNCLNANINENYIYKINAIYKTCIGKVTDESYKNSLIYKYQDVVGNNNLPFDVYFSTNQLSIDKLKNIETQYINIEKYDVSNSNNISENMGQLEKPLILNKITISSNFKLFNDTYFGNGYNIKKLISLIPIIDPNSFITFESKNNLQYILIFGNYENNVNDITLDLLVLDQNLLTKDLNFNVNSSKDPFVFYKVDIIENNLIVEMKFSLDILKNDNQIYKEYFYGKFQLFKDKIMLLNTPKEVYGNKVTNKQFFINNNFIQIKNFTGKTENGNLKIGNIKQNGKLKNIKIKGILNYSNTIKSGTELNFGINNYNKKIFVTGINDQLQNGSIVSFSNGSFNLGVINNQVKSLQNIDSIKWIINSDKDGTINSGDTITIKYKNSGLFLYPECNKTEKIERFSKEFVQEKEGITVPPNFGCDINTEDICEKDKKCYTKCNVSYLSNNKFKDDNYHTSDICSKSCVYNNTSIITNNIESKWQIFKILNDQKTEESIPIVNGDKILLVCKNLDCENEYNILVTISYKQEDNIALSNISNKNISEWNCNFYNEKEFKNEYNIEENIYVKKGDIITLSSNATNFEIFNLNFDLEIEPLSFLSIENNEIIHTPKWFELISSSLFTFVYQVKGKNEMILESNKNISINTNELISYFPNTGFSEFTPFPIFDIKTYNIELLGFVSTNNDNRNYDTFNKFCNKTSKRSFSRPMRVARSPNPVFKDDTGLNYYDVLYVDETDIDNPKNVIELFVPENEISIAHDACKLLQASFNLEAAYVFLSKTLCPYTESPGNGVIQKIISIPYVNCNINTYGCWNKATGCQSDSDCTGLTKDEHLNHTEASYGRGFGWVPDVKCPDSSCPKQQGIGTASWCDNSPTTPWDLNTCSSEISCGDGERCLELCYPKCRDGYHAVGCNVCARNSDSDTGEYDKVTYCNQEKNLFYETKSSKIFGDNNKFRTVSQIPNDVPKDGVGRNGQYSCASDNARVNNLNELIRNAPQTESPCKCQNPYTIPGKNNQPQNAFWNILPDRLVWSQMYDTNNYDNINCSTKVATTDCPTSYLTDTNISYKCYSKIWRDAGCTTEVPQSSQSDQLKYNNGKWFVNDSNAWARLDDDQHRIGCYGEDRTKWPPKNYKCNLNGVRKFMFDLGRIYSGETNIDYILIIDGTGARIEKEKSDYSGGNIMNVVFTNVSTKYSIDDENSLQILTLKYDVSYDFNTLDFKTFRQITLNSTFNTTIKFFDYPFYLEKKDIKLEKIPYNVICPNNFKETTISADCYRKIWKDAGCLTDKPANMDDNGNGYYKDKTGQWVIDDTNFWLTDNTKNSRTLCYGSDRSKWPSIPSECPTDVNNTNITYDCYNEIWRKAGCTNNPLQDINQNQDKTLQWFIDDTNSYSLSVDENKLNTCYGDDKGKWPSLGYVFTISFPAFFNKPAQSTTYILKISPYLSETIDGVEYTEGIVATDIDPPQNIVFNENTYDINKKITFTNDNFGKIVYKFSNNMLVQIIINGMPYIPQNNNLQKL